MARKQLIQLRRDTAANWASVNPILASGEQGYETDTLKLKIGDGTTAWNSLLYALNPQNKIFISVGVDGDPGYITDGVADQTQIQAAINAANAAGGGTVFLKEGSYAISSNINMASNVRLMGDARNSILNFVASSTLKIQSISNVEVTGIKINGNAHISGNYGIYVQDASDVLITENRFENMTGFGIFIAASASNTASRINIRDNYLQGKGLNDVIGGGPANSTGAVVSDVNIYGNTIIHDLTASGAGTYDNVFDIVKVQRVTFDNNICWGRVQFGTEQFPNTNSKISNNTIRPAIGATVTVVLVTTTAGATSNGDGIGITGNVIQSGPIEITGIAGQPVKHVTITGNTIRCETIADGIKLTYVSESTISGNIITKTTACVRLSNCTDIMISGNQFSSSSYGVRDLTGDDTIIVGTNSYKSISIANVVGANTAIEKVLTVGHGDAHYVTDGTADDVQIQAAIDALSARGGGVVKLLHGTFSTAAEITLKSNVSIEGMGAGVTVVNCSAGTTSWAFRTPILQTTTTAANVNTSTDSFAVTSSTVLPTGTLVRVTTSSSLPAGLSATTDYYIINVNSTTVKFATTKANALAGTAVDITGQGVGTHTIRVIDKAVYTNIWLSDFTINNVTASHTALIANTTNAGYLRMEAAHLDWATAIRETLVLQHCERAYFYDNFIHDSNGNGVQVNGCDHFHVRGNRVETYYLNTAKAGTYHMDDGVDIDEDFLDTHTIPSRYGYVEFNSVRGSDNGNNFRIASSQYVYVNNNISIDHNCTAAASILVNSYTGSGHPDTNNIYVYDNQVIGGTDSGIKVLYTSPSLIYEVYVQRNTLTNVGNTAASGQLGAGILLVADGVVCTDNILRACGKNSGDGAALMVYGSRNNQVLRRNKVFNSPGTAVRFWNGNGTSTYTGIVMEDTEVSGNLSDYQGIVNTITTFVAAKRNQGLNPDRTYAQGNATGATTFNRINGETITATMTGNVTATITAGSIVGDILNLVLTQDATGSRTMTWPSNFKRAGGTLTLSTAAGATDIITMMWNGTNWIETNRVMGVA